MNTMHNSYDWASVYPFQLLSQLMRCFKPETGQQPTHTQACRLSAAHNFNIHTYILSLHTCTFHIDIQTHRHTHAYTYVPIYLHKYLSTYVYMHENGTNLQSKKRIWRRKEKRLLTAGRKVYPLAIYSRPSFKWVNSADTRPPLLTSLAASSW
jgi:kynurenine formamidase